MKRGEEERPLDEVARDTRRRLEVLKRKSVIDQRDVYRLFKRFFQEYLQKRYEFTMEELRHEIHCIYLNHTVRERIEGLIDELALLEYSDREFEQSELQTMLNDFEAIIQALVKSPVEELSFIAKLKQWFSPAGKREELGGFPASERQEKTLIEFNTLLERIYEALDERKVRLAARHYKELMRRYETLEPLEQHRFYHEVHRAYKAITER